MGIHEEIKETLQNRCNLCNASFEGKSVHMLKCKQHAYCLSCFKARDTTISINGCEICSMNSAISLPLSGNAESVTSALSKINLSGEASQLKTASSCDLRRGVEYVNTYQIPPIEDLMEPQSDGQIALLCNKPKPSVLYLDSAGNQTAIEIPNTALAHFGCPISESVTALVVQKIEGASTHLAFFNISFRNRNMRLIRLFSEKSPASPRCLFSYNPSYLGIYSREPTVNITLMGKDHYEIHTNIKLGIKDGSSDADRVAANSSGDFFITLPKPDLIIQCNIKGELVRKICTKGTGYRDPPGVLWGPMGIGIDTNDTLIAGVLNGSLHVYSDRRWSMVKVPTEPGDKVRNMLLTDDSVYVVSREDKTKNYCIKFFRIL